MQRVRWVTRGGRLRYGTLLLRLPRGNGRGGGFPGSGGPFLWGHGCGGFLSPGASTEFPTLRALLTEELQDVGRKSLLRHEKILLRVLVESNISLYLVGGLSYNQEEEAG